MNNRKPINGKEANILSMLAQYKDIPKESTDKILSVLDGTALEIANAILGIDKNPAPDIKAAAKSFHSLAQKSGKNK